MSLLAEFGVKNEELFGMSVYKKYPKNENLAGIHGLILTYKRFRKDNIKYDSIGIHTDLFESDLYEVIYPTSDGSKLLVKEIYGLRYAINYFVEVVKDIDISKISI